MMPPSSSSRSDGRNEPVAPRASAERAVIAWLKWRDLGNTVAMRNGVRTMCGTIPQRPSELMESGELTSGGFDGESADLELCVSAIPDDVRLVRLLASGVAAQAGFGIDEIEAVRLVIDEACVVLLDTCEPGSGSRRDELTVRVKRGSGRLWMCVARPMARATSDPAPLSTRVLDGLSSRWSVHLDDVPTVMVWMQSTHRRLDGHHG